MSASASAPGAIAANSAGLLLIACLSLSSRAEAQEHKVGASFRDCPEVCPELVVIPPGNYLMGAAPDDPHQNPAGEEQPQHRVTSAYALAVGKYEVTRDEYAVFVRETIVLRNNWVWDRSLAARDASGPYAILPRCSEWLRFSCG
jgi:formylglycine-generating enzyme required for sulfatase activity